MAVRLYTYFYSITILVHFVLMNLCWKMISSTNNTYTVPVFIMNAACINCDRLVSTVDNVNIYLVYNVLDIQYTVYGITYS